MNTQIIDVYNFIVLFYAQHGYVPTIRQIMDGTPYHATASVVYALKVLAIWGWIKRESRTGRGMVLMRPTEYGLSAEALQALIGAVE